MRPGIQISTFRPLMRTEKEMRQTLMRVAALGCGLVQLQWIDPSIPIESIARALKEAGLVSVSAQDLFDSVCSDKDYYLRLNELTGGKWLCVSRIPDRMKSPEGMARFFVFFLLLSEAAKARGQALCFHPVAADYREIGGLCPVDEMLARVPDMKLCLDLYHLDKAGYSIPAFIERHGERVGMVHFKDERDGLLVPAGQGSVRYDGAVKACLRARVSCGFVEQESWDRDPFECVKEALNWLRGELAAGNDEEPAEGREGER